MRWYIFWVVIFVFLHISLPSKETSPEYIQDLFDYSHLITLDESFVLRAGILLHVGSDKSYVLSRSVGEDTTDGLFRLYVYEGNNTDYSYRKTLKHPLETELKSFEKIDANDSFICLSGSRHIFIYDKNTYELIKIINLEGYIANKIKIVGDILWGISSKPKRYRPAPPTDIIIFKIDLKTFELKTHFLPTPKNKMLLKFLHRNTVAINKNFIAQSEITDYFIKIYDHNFNLLDSIASDQLKDNINQINNKSDKGSLWELTSKVYQMKLIEYIYFSGDELIVHCSVPDGEDNKKYFFDVFIHDVATSKWIKKYSNLKDYKYELDENFDFNKFSMKYSVINGEYSTSFRPVSIFPTENEDFNKYTELRNKSDEIGSKYSFLVHKRK